MLSVSRKPPPRPTAVPTSTPMPRSPSEPPRPVDECATVSATAPAMKKLTNGVAMPSFSPLSTFRIRRIRAGTCSSSTTWAPSAASVGATAAAMTAAAHGSRCGKSTTATAVPTAMVSGRPTSRRRSSTPASRRNNTRRLTRAASEKSRSASVTSARLRSVSACTLTSIADTGSLASTNPTTTNAIGALMLSASNLAETSPQPMSDAAMATIRPVSRVSTAAPSACSGCRRQGCATPRPIRR